ncbi:pyrroline-5-carboxylate reductase [Halovulum sp. GXIMD14793]
MSRVALIGCGNMGYAMLRGWMAAGGHSVTVVEPNADLRDRASAEGAGVLTDAEGLTEAPDLIFLAVKPQMIPQVAPTYARFAGGASTFVSVAAGTTLASLAGWLPGPTPLIRTMPNTPAAIGQGMLVSVANDLVSEATRDVADQLLSASGETAWITDEALMDAVTAISGSGPAYVFHLIECMAEAGENLGLPAELALQLARQTVAGAGALARGSDAHPGILREQVTSPGGTTAAALDVLMGENGLAPLVTRATTAARDRSVALGR